MTLTHARRQSAHAKRRAELVRMFGPGTVMLAELVDPESLTLTEDVMEQVLSAADTQLAFTLRPETQRHYVAGLPHEIRVILCVWLLLGMRGAAKLMARLVPK